MSREAGRSTWIIETVYPALQAAASTPSVVRASPVRSMCWVTTPMVRKDPRRSAWAARLGE